MSTRAHIEIMNDDESNTRVALLYRHSDGMPARVLESLQAFVSDFKDKRGYDPEYLAARLLQHLTNEYDSHMAGTSYAGVLGYGISADYHGDIEYLYQVYADKIEVYDMDTTRYGKKTLIQTIEY